MQILYEGVRVYTLWDEAPQAEAILVENGIIRAVGGRKDLAFAFPGAKRVALEGGAVIPAFNDCHCHILWLGFDLIKADLHNCRSIPEIQAELRNWAERHPDRPWIMGRGYDQDSLVEGRTITCRDLDAVSPYRPVYINHVSRHAAVVNSAVLRMAGISGSTPDPKEGGIARDEHGEPTGVFLEYAMKLIEQHLPYPTEAEMAQAVEHAAHYMARRGILAASDAGTGMIDLELEWQAFSRAIERGAPLRVTIMPELRSATRAGWFSLESISSVEDAIRTNWGIEPQANLRLGPVKLYADGSITARTAALNEPYNDRDSTGLLLMEPEKLMERVSSLHRKGFQCATHAIGDRAIEWILKSYRKAEQEFPRPDARHRIEHCMITNDELLRQMRELEVIAVAQPEFFRRLGHAYRRALGARAEKMMPYRSWLKKGIPLAFSSDQPIVSGDPIVGWRAAVTRQGKDGSIFGPEERLDPLEALRGYTLGSAYATFDDEIGMLAPGKRADFVILSHPPEKLLEEDMKVVGVSCYIAAGIS